jgi:hypothetical protein
MRLPGSERPQFLGIFHIVEIGEHFTKFVRRFRRNAFRAFALPSA